MDEATRTSEAERIRKVIRKLNLALASCHEFLAEVERPVEEAKEGVGGPRPVH